MTTQVSTTLDAKLAPSRPQVAPASASDYSATLKSSHKCNTNNLYSNTHNVRRKINNEKKTLQFFDLKCLKTTTTTTITINNNNLLNNFMF